MNARAPMAPAALLATLATYGAAVRLERGRVKLDAFPGSIPDSLLVELLREQFTIAEHLRELSSDDPTGAEL